MEIKVIEGAFSVCRLKELGQAVIEDICIFWAGQMRRYPWCAGLKACPRTLLQGKMDGGPFGFRENWIFL